MSQNHQYQTTEQSGVWRQDIPTPVRQTPPGVTPRGPGQFYTPETPRDPGQLDLANTDTRKTVTIHPRQVSTNAFYTSQEREIPFMSDTYQLNLSQKANPKSATFAGCMDSFTTNGGPFLSNDNNGCEVRKDFKTYEYDARGHQSGYLKREESSTLNAATQPSNMKLSSTKVDITGMTGVSFTTSSNMVCQPVENMDVTSDLSSYSNNTSKFQTRITHAIEGAKYVTTVHKEMKFKSIQCNNVIKTTGLYDTKETIVHEQESKVTEYTVQEETEIDLIKRNLINSTESYLRVVQFMKDTNVGDGQDTRNIRGEDIAKLIGYMYQHLYHEGSGGNARNLYSTRPHGWPPNLAFGNPHNVQPTTGRKIPVPDLRLMCQHLYQKWRETYDYLS